MRVEVVPAVELAAEWDVMHVPAVNTRATITKAAPGARQRLVCRGFTVTLSAGTVAPTAVNLTVSLIDGVSGGTAYLWRTTLSLQATAGVNNVVSRDGIYIVGLLGTAMTLEFSAAGGANTFQSVSMEGCTIGADN